MRTSERPGAPAGTPSGPADELTRRPLSDLERRNEVLEDLLRQKQRDLDTERELRIIARQQCTEAERRAVELASLIPASPPSLNATFPATIVASEDTRSGHPRLCNTRLCVHDIVSGVRNYDGNVLMWWRREFPHLTLQQVLAALGYYVAHQAEIDRILAERQADYEALLPLEQG